MATKNSIRKRLSVGNDALFSVDRQPNEAEELAIDHNGDNQKDVKRLMHKLCNDEPKEKDVAQVKIQIENKLMK